MTDDHKGERIAKKIARAGICSRREAERLIESGKVSVNGKAIASPALNVTEQDKITVNGHALNPAQNTRLFLYHKPTGLVTSARDEKGRATVFDTLPAHLPRVISVGRLDMNSEGLLLLTNDGGLSRHLELPATGWKRQYRVRVHGRVHLQKLARLKKGIKIEGIHYKSITAELEHTQGANSWIKISLREGKNREIRRVMEAIDLTVNRLIRTDYGPFSLGNLEKNNVTEVKTQILKSQIPNYFKTP